MSSTESHHVPGICMTLSLRSPLSAMLSFVRAPYKNDRNRLLYILQECLRYDLSSCETVYRQLIAKKTNEVEESRHMQPW